MSRVDKGKLLEIFRELLEAWEDSECTVIHDRGNIDDYEQLRISKEKYIMRFLDVLND